HRLAIGVGRKLSPLIISTVRRKVHEPANGGSELQVPDLTSQGDRTEHRATVGIDGKSRTGQVMALRKGKEMSWRIRGDRAGRSAETLALAAAALGRTLRAKFEMHRQGTIGGRLHCCRQQQKQRRQNERSSQRTRVAHSSPVSPLGPFFSRGFPRSGWT